MNKKLLSLTFASLTLANLAVAVPVTLVNDATLANYNATLGTSLDLTNPFGGNNMFPAHDVTTGDPVLNIPSSSAPDLSAASAQLGDWLGDPANLNANWTAPEVIPGTWAINTETAIVYTLNLSGASDNTVASIGVDNGVFLWVDGAFQGGYLRPGGAFAGEHVFNLGTLDAGTHYIQVLREDHGGATGYTVNVTGDVQRTEAVPEPGTFALIGLGLAGLFGMRRKLRA